MNELKILKAIREGKMNYAEIIRDLMDLVMFWTERRLTFGELFPITEELLAEAEQLAKIISFSDNPEKQVELQEELDALLVLQQKAFVYYRTAYEEVRRACISSLYYEGGEKLLPKFLTAGRTSKKSSSKPAPKPSADTLA